MTLQNPTSIPAYVINLDRCPEKWHTMQTRLRDLPYTLERISAVDGKTMSLNDSALQKVVDQTTYQRWHGKHISMSEIGCYLSHINTLRKIVETGAPFALVFEDDALPNADFVAVVDALIAQNDTWDIVKLSGYHEPHLLHAQNIFDAYRLGKAAARHCNTAALLYTQAGAQRALAQLLPMQLPFDHALERPWAHDYRLRVVHPSPCAASDGSASTIVIHQKFVWYRRLPAYAFRLGNEFKRIIWAARP